MLKALAWLFRRYIRFLHSTGGFATNVRILPFGSAAGTYFVAKFVCDGSLLFWHNWDAVIQALGLGVIAYSFTTASLEGIIMLGIMAAEYLRNKEKRTNEKAVRELLESAENPAERRLALRWADDHGGVVENLRDAEGRPYFSRYRHRCRRRFRR